MRIAIAGWNEVSTERSRRDPYPNHSTAPLKGILLCSDILSGPSMNYTLQEAKTKFPELVKRACAGEEVIICRGKRPVVKLEPLSASDKPAPARKALGRRTPGAWKGKILWTEDAFPNLTNKRD